MAGRGKISQQTTYQVSYSGGHWVGNDKLGCAQANAGIRKLLLQLEEEDGGERCAAGIREVEGGDKSEGDEERDEESLGNMTAISIRTLTPAFPPTRGSRGRDRPTPRVR